MKVTNNNCKSVSIQSDLITDVLTNTNKYLSLELSANINCCDQTSKINVPIELWNNSICNTCNNKYVWSFDLTTLANTNKKINKITVVNVVNSTTYDILFTNLNFSLYQTTCPNNSCTISSIPSYIVAFDSPIDTWFTNNAMWSNTKTTICGNVLQICDLPPNFAVKEIEYTDGTFVETSKFNYVNQSDLVIVNNNIHLLPEFFNSDKIIDGVYKIQLKATLLNGSWVSEENCAFIDCTLKCKVGKFVETIIAKDKENTQNALNITMAHYALLNASNCGCNCKELCEIYKDLFEKISGIKLNNDCGC